MKFVCVCIGSESAFVQVFFFLLIYAFDFFPCFHFTRLHLLFLRSEKKKKRMGNIEFWFSWGASGIDWKFRTNTLTKQLEIMEDSREENVNDFVLN